MTGNLPTTEAMRVYWQDRGAYWDNAADIIADVTAGLNSPLIEIADIQPDQKILDLASGAGEPALTIALLVGPNGEVTATDLVPEMLAGAERRAAEKNISNIQFEIADMAALPFKNDSFDRVICRFGIMFCEDPVKCFAECLRVLKSRGKTVFMVWGPRENTTQFNVFSDVAIDVFGSNAAYNGDAPYRFGVPNSLIDPMHAAGFIEAEEIELQFEPAVPEKIPFWRSQVGMNFGPLIAASDDPPAMEARLDDALHSAFAPLISDGKYHLKLHARVATAIAP
jgi:ubiquinone/menaquinone biosynthesis C-methylase UbiE